jgi:hypothetical protein
MQADIVCTIPDETILKKQSLPAICISQAAFVDYTQFFPKCVPGAAWTNELASFFRAYVNFSG